MRLRRRGSRGANGEFASAIFGTGCGVFLYMGRCGRTYDFYPRIRG